MIPPAVNAKRIQGAYEKLGYQAGWRFLTCPEARFKNPAALLVSLNPSGRVEHGPRWSQEAGSAYVDESWDDQPAGSDTLQIQIQRLVQHLGLSFSQLASAHFVPFRSQRWADLANQRAAFAFSNDLWSDFVPELAPKYVICLGTTVGRFMINQFGVSHLRKLKTGWGDISLSIGTTKDGGQFAVLPHLGTFKLFSRDACMPFLKEALGPESFANA